MIFPAAAVCVIIAARNASASIARAVRSALREPQVAEVVVVDDGSTDATSDAARAADDGSGRLRIVVLQQNRGPAAARNRAIECSTAPLIAVLDADDFLLPGRFERLLGETDWDFVADNIVFVDARQAHVQPEIPTFADEPRFLDLAAFVRGNISRRGQPRGEIGFLKPVIRRAFLDDHGLRYGERLRLGEDYDLYTRALVSGARFKIVHGCGYCAVVRADSLSGRHATGDLQRLFEADQAILSSAGLAPAARDQLRRHQRHVRARYELRCFLDTKSRAGLLGAARHALAHPLAVPAIVAGIAADKLDALRALREPPSKPAGQRFLLPARLVSQV